MRKIRSCHSFSLTYFSIRAVGIVAARGHRRRVSITDHRVALRPRRRRQRRPTNTNRSRAGRAQPLVRPRSFCATPGGGPDGVERAAAGCAPTVTVIRWRETVRHHRRAARHQLRQHTVIRLLGVRGHHVVGADVLHEATAGRQRRLQPRLGLDQQHVVPVQYFVLQVHGVEKGWCWWILHVLGLLPTKAEAWHNITIWNKRKLKYLKY